MHLNIKRIFSMLVLLLASFTLQATVKDIERLFAEQRYQEAYELGYRDLSQEAGNPNFDMIFGVSAQRAGELDQALFAFERVLMYDSKTQVARFELARTHFMLGNLITARRHFNQLLESDPQPPSEAMKRIQWYMAAIDAREAGKAVAANDGITRIYLGVRLGYDSNPNNMTQKDVLLYNVFPLPMPDIKSDTFHELTAGATRYQQQGDNWGWFAGANASLKGFHDEHTDMDNYSFGLQGGGILLGKDWRLSIPLQISKQVRDDDNEVLVLALSAEFNKYINSKSDYTLFGQLATIDYKPGDLRDVKSFTSGLIYSYRITEKIRFYGGPVIGQENSDFDDGKHFSRNILGLHTGLIYAFNDQQKIDLDLNYKKANYKHEDPAFLKKRSDNQLGLGIKFSHRPAKDWLIDFGIDHSNHSSTLNLYSYHSTQVSAGVRKEW